MKKVFKYRLDRGNRTELMLPGGTEVLHVGVQKEEDSPITRLYLWALVDPTRGFVRRYFDVVKTGQDVRNDGFVTNHVGTVFDEELVWHVFEHV